MIECHHIQHFKLMWPNVVAFMHAYIILECLNGINNFSIFTIVKLLHLITLKQRPSFLNHNHAIWTKPTHLWFIPWYNVWKILHLSSSCDRDKTEQYWMLNIVVHYLNQLVNIKPWGFIKTYFNGICKFNNLNILKVNMTN